MRKRIIGKYTEGRNGPLLLVLGAVHGNEPAGVKALEYLFKMLEVEHITNPKFKFNGTICGIIGNISAYKKRVRYINQDLNRLWLDYEKANCPESEEIKDIILTTNKLVKKHQPQQLIVLDIHTTSSGGGIFVIPGLGKQSMKIAKKINAPVINNMLGGISGTTMHYFIEEHTHIRTNSLTFESGQHEDPLSINRAIAGIINCMKAINMVEKKHVENIHDKILTEYSKDLPNVTSLIYKHAISPNDTFTMKPNYLSFQKIVQGEHLANQNGVKVLAPYGGRILMPLYQKLGSEGFYIIQDQD